MRLNPFQTAIWQRLAESKAYQRMQPYLLKGWQLTRLYWQKMWHKSFFNRDRYRSLGFGKKLLSLLYTGFLCLFLFILAIEINFLWLFGYSPGMGEVINPQIPLITEIYSADEVLLGKMYLEYRTPVSYEEIHPQTLDALVATEDIRFYSHHGLDLYGLAAAVVSTLKGDKRGGSTITQQLAKNVYNTRRNSARGLLGRIPVVGTLVAKLKEWLTAIKIELFFSKQEILAMYLNAVEFGNRTFGLHAAASYYFSKEPKDLKLEESALLIGVLKGTNFYDPIDHPDRALERRNVVLSQMAKYSFIDSTEQVKLAKRRLRLRIRENVREEGIAPYFRAALNRHLREWCEDNDYNLYTSGLRIYTTLHSRMQGYAEQSVWENMIRIQQRFEAESGRYRNWFDDQIAREKRTAASEGTEGPTPTEAMLDRLIRHSGRYQSLIQAGYSPDSAKEKMEERVSMTLFYQNGARKVRRSPIDSIKHVNQLLQCGLVSIEPTSGQVKAWVGGLDWDFFQYDHVDLARRQPGSTFKPILYAAALREGVAPCDEYFDEPLCITTYEDGEEVLWEPRNSSRQYSFENQTLRMALAQSTNTVAVTLTQEIGPGAVAKMAQRLGIESELDETPSIGLGTSSVNLLELTRAYTAFANAGKLSPVVLVERIENQEGKNIARFAPKSRQVMDEKDAYSMSFLLRGSVEESSGTSRGLCAFGLCSQNEIGGKTGTSDDNADGWFVAVTPNLVTGAWVGADDMRIHFESGNGQGGRTALPLVGRYMQLVYSNAKRTGISRGTFPVPEDYDVYIGCATRRAVSRPSKPKPKPQSIIDSISVSPPKLTPQPARPPDSVAIP